MRANNYQKPLEGWHPADIKAAIQKTKYRSFRGIERKKKLARDSIKKVLRVPYPKGERLVADVIGVAPQAIWPSRYNADGTPNRKRGPRTVETYSNSKSSSRNTCRQVAAQ